MPSIFFQETLPFDELASLSQEFPQYDILTECEDPALWSRVKIIYGNKLSEEELHLAPRLGWIHCTTADTEGLCLREIHRKKILVTLTKGQNVHQIGEFVIGGILAFAKQFFHWPKAPSDPDEFWNWPLKDTVWTLKNKILLQVGLGAVGTEIARLAEIHGMKTWGMREHRSFNPYCKKSFPVSDLHSLLPAADVVVLALPKMIEKECLFGKEEFRLMKTNSIFIVVGSGENVDEVALAEVARSGKFRGILIDAYTHHPPAKHYPLRDIPNAILTPSIASLPLSEERIAFRLFRKNLRAFVPDHINEMENLIV